MAKLVNEGESDVLNIYLKNAAQNANLYLGLYTNSTEPAETITLATISEVADSGYARITLAPAGWTVSATAPTQALHSQQTFTFTASVGSEVVYGYFICNVASGTAGKIIFVQHATTPFTITTSGDQIKITPKITCD